MSGVAIATAIDGIMRVWVEAGGENRCGWEVVVACVNSRDVTAPAAQLLLLVVAGWRCCTWLGFAADGLVAAAAADAGVCGSVTPR